MIQRKKLEVVSSRKPKKSAGSRLKFLARTTGVIEQGKAWREQDTDLPTGPFDHVWAGIIESRKESPVVGFYNRGWRIYFYTEKPHENQAVT